MARSQETNVSTWQCLYFQVPGKQTVGGASTAAAFSHPSTKKDSDGGQQISEDGESNKGDTLVVVATHFKLFTWVSPVKLIAAGQQWAQRSLGG